jgi:tetratricopeptide (TPR) repeat protein
MDDLLVITDSEGRNVHPVWGWCSHGSLWSDAIHRILVNLNVDSDIQQTLDKALALEDAAPKVAALNEFSRWFAEADLGPEREATWRTPERLQRLVGFALKDANQNVRTAAAGALGWFKSEVVQKSLMDALAEKAVDVQVAAGDALVRIGAQDQYGRVAEVMLQVAKADHALDLRRRAAKVLTAIPGGVELFYPPIQAELGRAGWERALEMIEDTLQIIPEEEFRRGSPRVAILFWWGGHALRSLGRLGQAADSYQHASELEERASVIPQALARIFLELPDYPRAMEAGRRGTETAPGDAEAQSILAWSSYKAGAVPEAVEAASKAVDLDPVHGDAIWIALLGHIRQGNLEQSRLAFQHAMRVRRVLSPGLDTSFLTSFMKEIAGIETDDAEISRLMVEIKDALTVD